MSNSPSTLNWMSKDVHASQTKPSVFNRIGHSLGRLFLAAKRRATHKYLEVTQGINEKIEAEKEQFYAEMHILLDEQDAEHNAELSRLKKRWLLGAILGIVVSFVCGMVVTLYYFI